MWEGVKNYEGGTGAFLTISAGKRGHEESKIIIVIIKGERKGAATQV